MGAVIVGAKKASNEPFFILPSASERVESKHINRELKNHDDDFVDDDRK